MVLMSGVHAEPAAIARAAALAPESTGRAGVGDPVLQVGGAGNRIGPLEISLRECRDGAEITGVDLGSTKAGPIGKRQV
jgi:hypothetical protein